MRLEDICTVFTDGDWIESKDQSDEGIRLVQTGKLKSKNLWMRHRYYLIV